MVREPLDRITRPRARGPRHAVPPAALPARHPRQPRRRLGRWARHGRDSGESAWWGAWGAVAGADAVVLVVGTNWVERGGRRWREAVGAVPAGLAAQGVAGGGLVLGGGVGAVGANGEGGRGRGGGEAGFPAEFLQERAQGRNAAGGDANARLDGGPDGDVDGGEEEVVGLREGVDVRDANNGGGASAVVRGTSVSGEEDGMEGLRS